MKLITTQSRLLMTLNEKAFENIVGKGENAGNQHFLLFPQCVQPFPKRFLVFRPNFFCRLQNAFILDQSKLLSFAKRVKADESMGCNETQT